MAGAVPADPRAPAPPISLDAYRQRRLAQASAAARPAPSPKVPTFAQAAPGCVTVGFSDRSELNLSPTSARFWAEQLACMADTAEQLAKDADFICDPDGGRRG